MAPTPVDERPERSPLSQKTAGREVRSRANGLFSQPLSLQSNQGITTFLLKSALILKQIVLKAGLFRRKSGRLQRSPRLFRVLGHTKQHPTQVSALRRTKVL
jgi:hypothetical protein